MPLTSEDKKKLYIGGAVVVVVIIVAVAFFMLRKPSAKKAPTPAPAPAPGLALAPAPAPVSNLKYLQISQTNSEIDNHYLILNNGQKIVATLNKALATPVQVANTQSSNYVNYNNALMTTDGNFIGVVNNGSFSQAGQNMIVYTPTFSAGDQTYTLNGQQTPIFSFVLNGKNLVIPVPGYGLTYQLNFYQSDDFIIYPYFEALNADSVNLSIV